MASVEQAIIDVFELIGRPAKDELQMSDLAFNVLLELDIAALELVNSSKGQAYYKFIATIPANTREGSITDTGKATDYSMVYWYISENWYHKIKIVEDFQDLLKAEAEGYKAIMFLDGNKYRLSWMPTDNLTFWMFSKQIVIQTTDLAAPVNIPDLFVSVFTHRAAMSGLDELLLPHIKTDYSRFVQARKRTLAMRMKKLEHFWMVYRTVESADNDLIVTDWYDPVEDFFRNG